MSTTEDNIDLSLEEKRALLAQLLQEKASKSNTFPVSFAQQRLWLLDQLEPNSPLYNVPQATRIGGPLNLQALQQTLDAIVARHEILRTTFTMVDGSPMQVIAESRAVALPVIDLSELPENDREAEALRLAAADSRRPFNLEHGPLLRTSLLRLSEEDHVLLLNTHHIISDAWSTAVFVRELTALYEAFSLGKPSPLEELPIQYADYAVWQREWLQGEVYERHLSYWKQQLSGAPTVLEIPTDRPRPAVQSHRGALHTLTLAKSLAGQLRRLSRQEGVTMFMTLLAAFQTLLMRYSGQEDIVLGTPIAGRTRAETEGMIGFFLNTLVLRTDLSGEPTFRELLGRVRETTLLAYEYQDVPFEKIVEELQPERSLSHTPLFQVMFTLQNAPRQNLELSRLALRPLQVEHDIAKFDLMLSVAEGADTLKLALEYNTDLFDASTVERMAGHFQVLLEGIAADPEQRVSTLPMLTEIERRQLLVEWNDTRADYPDAGPVHKLFEAQAERTPDATAVVFGKERLAYRELNERANQVAHHLRALGVAPDVRVGVCMERSVEMVVGVLGILKAGGAYVPLDPAYPQERLAFMVEDTEAPVLLTQKRLVKGLPKSRAQLVCLDIDWKVVARQNKGNPTGEMKADNLAYVIYTSGSTGRPKGVAMTHGSLVNLLSWQLRNSALPGGAKTLQFASLSFDVSFQEMFSSWCAGGALVLITEELRRDTVGLLRFLTDEAITRLFLPFIALQQLAEVADERGLLPADLREVVTAGEQLQITRQIASLFSKLKNCTLHNQYGPSESHVVTAFTLTGPPSSWVALPPIGRPIANTQIFVLDRHSNPVPVGVPGELHIGGVSLARGYLNRPELTAERFITDPFSREPGARLYRTGDVARYLSDGTIEYAGRVDDQVKVRGYRIELGEVEAILSQHPAVRETAVMVREDNPGDKRLVAYVVLEEEQAPSVSEVISLIKKGDHLVAHAGPRADQSPGGSELRGYLKERLPEYMVPSAFVVLEELPLTPSGKVNRRVLPAPDGARPELNKTFVAPRDTLELQLTKMWERTLGVARIGVKDNFFDLGGHSLLAVRLFAQIEKTFDKNLPLATLFQAPTIEQLADILRQRGWATPWTSLVAIQPGGSKPPFFCVHAGGGQVFFYRDLAHRLGPDQPFYGLQIRSLNGVDAPHDTVEDMAAHYITEMRTLQPEGPYFLGGASFGGVVAFEMAQQLHAQSQKVGLIALFDTNGPNYPRLLPGVTSRRLKLNHLKQRVEHHLGSLRMLEPKGKLTYFVEKANKIPQLIKQSLKNRFRKIAPRLYRTIGRELPPALQKSHNIILQAYNEYVPQVYPGQVTIFRARTQMIGVYPDPTLGWDGLAARGLEVHEITGFHGAMIAEPRVRFLAEKLTDCLAKARAAEPSEQTEFALFAGRQHQA